MLDEFCTEWHFGSCNNIGRADHPMNCYGTKTSLPGSHHVVDQISGFNTLVFRTVIAACYFAV